MDTGSKACTHIRVLAFYPTYPIKLVYSHNVKNWQYFDERYATRQDWVRPLLFDIYALIDYSQLLQHGKNLCKGERDGGYLLQ